jgi:hypothetical protein
MRAVTLPRCRAICRPGGISARHRSPARRLRDGAALALAGERIMTID